MPGRLTAAEKERLAELVAAKTPFSVICELIGGTAGRPGETSIT